MIKELLKKTFVYTIYKKNKAAKIQKRLKGAHVFESRSKNTETLVLVLAGYKEFCMDVVFERIKKFSPVDADVCIVSSGLYSEKLSKYAEQNNWSYISCKRNNVCSALNICINEFKSAKKIFKIDEDIFITKNFFNSLLKVYDDCQKEKSLYQPTFVAPMIPINGFGHVYILKRLGLVEKYENLFESVRMQAGPYRQIENNPDVAKFMWGEKEFVPQIDDLDRLLNGDEFSYITCPIKFSIGAILFDRDTWKNLMYFIPGKDPSMGLDEIQLCQYAMLESKPIIVCKNTCVGHLSFGKQNAEMKKYFLEHRDIFEIKNKTKENA